MKCALFFVLSMFCGSVCAQTVGDPVPILGNNVTNAASASAMGSALSPRTGSMRTPAQNAARLRDLEWVKACRAEARINPPGKKRSELVKKCNDEFEQRRQFWN